MENYAGQNKMRIANLARIVISRVVRTYIGTMNFEKEAMTRIGCPSSNAVEDERKGIAETRAGAYARLCGSAAVRQCGYAEGDSRK